MPQPSRDRLLAALREDRAGLRRQLVDLTLDAALDLPLRELVEPPVLAAAIGDALARDNAARWVERHLEPGGERHRERAGEHTWGELLTPALRARLMKLVAESDGPRGTWLRGAVDPALVRRLVAPAVQQTLLSFARSLPLPGIGGMGGGEDAGAGGLFGKAAGRLVRGVEKRAEKLADLGRSALGGLGAELERQLEKASREFSQAAIRQFNEAMAARLRSEEGREIVAEVRRSVLAHVLDTPIGEIHADVQRLPLQGIGELLPDIVDHARGTELFRRAVDDEIAAVLRVEGARSLRDLLDEAGMLEALRPALYRRGNRIAEAVVHGEGFAAWLDSLLAEAGGGGGDDGTASPE